jgi:hypothetical protein
MNTTLEKTFLIMGHEIKIIQFSPEQPVQFKINAPNDNVAMAIMQYLYKEDMLNPKFINQ